MTRASKTLEILRYGWIAALGGGKSTSGGKSFVGELACVSFGKISLLFCKMKVK